MHQIKNMQENKEAQRHRKVTNINFGLPTSSGFCRKFSWHQVQFRILLG